ncbi:VOC family protein [Paracoccus sp. IB05]|uniref:VOC family protein n=1 Tax=Paracoccus sp. IB05 TaxID=2779367 RepID=UPI0018E906CF|nr:VOC family protein [Paracoccus sp. IB05]MBJ2154025.1 VOC family protein [Paracoccus sp. IB05]
MRYLHTMVRVADLEASLAFYCGVLGLQETRRRSSEAGRYTIVYLAAPDDLAAVAAQDAPILELTWNWDPEAYTGGRNFGHLAYEVADIHETCARIAAAGITINRPPRDGYMAFIRSPDGISIEFLQHGEQLTPEEPWASLPNSGSW